MTAKRLFISLINLFRSHVLENMKLVQSQDNVSHAIYLDLNYAF